MSLVAASLHVGLPPLLYGVPYITAIALLARSLAPLIQAMAAYRGTTRPSQPEPLEKTERGSP